MSLNRAVTLAGVALVLLMGTSSSAQGSGHTPPQHSTGGAHRDVVELPPPAPDTRGTSGPRRSSQGPTPQGEVVTTTPPAPPGS